MRSLLASGTTKALQNTQKGYSELSPDKTLVLKYDMDDVKVFALLRSLDRESFTLDDFRTGFEKVAKMVEGKRDRMPMASVSFLWCENQIALLMKKVTNQASKRYYEQCTWQDTEAMCTHPFGCGKLHQLAFCNVSVPR